jgi:phage I-like protein
LGFSARLTGGASSATGAASFAAAEPAGATMRGIAASDFLGEKFNLPALTAIGDSPCSTASA